MTSEEKIDKILRHVEKMDRGIYGDPDNGVPGLIKENKDQEERIIRLERYQDRQKWYLGGVGVVIMVLWEMVGDYIKGVFK